VDARVGGVRLLELLQRGGRGPGAGRVGDVLVLATGEVRGQDAVVALGDERRVVVGRGALHHDDVRALDAPRRDAGLEALAHQLANLDVVEADVVAAGATEG